MCRISLKDSRARCGWLEVGVIMARLWIIRRDTRRRLWQMNKQAARRSLITLHFTGLPCCGCWCLFNWTASWPFWSVGIRVENALWKTPEKTKSNQIGSYFDRISLKLFFAKVCSNNKESLCEDLGDRPNTQLYFSLCEWMWKIMFWMFGSFIWPCLCLPSEEIGRITGSRNVTSLHTRALYYHTRRFLTTCLHTDKLL